MSQKLNYVMIKDQLSRFFGNFDVSKEEELFRGKRSVVDRMKYLFHLWASLIIHLITGSHFFPIPSPNSFGNVILMRFRNEKHFNLMRR